MIEIIVKNNKAKIGVDGNILEVGKEVRGVIKELKENKNDLFIDTILVAIHDIYGAKYILDVVDRANKAEEEANEIINNPENKLEELKGLLEIMKGLTELEDNLKKLSKLKENEEKDKNE